LEGAKNKMAFYFTKSGYCSTWLNHVRLCGLWIAQQRMAKALLMSGNKRILLRENLGVNNMFFAAESIVKASKNAFARLKTHR